MKGILFAAYFINLVALYLAYQSSKRHKSNLSLIVFFVGIAHFILATLFTVNFLWSLTPWLAHVAPLLWFFIIFGVILALIGLVNQHSPSLFLSASTHLFLVLPTIFSIGVFILIVAIVELALAFFIFYRKRHLWV